MAFFAAGLAGIRSHMPNATPVHVTVDVLPSHPPLFARHPVRPTQCAVQYAVGKVAVAE